jgi:myosin V
MGGVEGLLQSLPAAAERSSLSRHGRTRSFARGRNSVPNQASTLRIGKALYSRRRYHCRRQSRTVDSRLVFDGETAVLHGELCQCLLQRWYVLVIGTGSRFSWSWRANFWRLRMTGHTAEEKKDDHDIVAHAAASSMLFGSSEYDRLGCEPHIYEVSSLAYRGLKLDRKDQTILVSGESGSGKTESVKIVLKHLASLCHGQATLPDLREGDLAGGDDLILHLLASSPIFEAFGNAKTTRNSNSSRFGKVTKLHYTVTNSDTVLAGVSFDTYLLETNRVVSHADKERNFQIFYQLLSASTEVKKELLGLDWGHTVPSDFLYLTTSSGSAVENKRDINNWNETLKALICFGWDGASLERLMRALGIVLLIGNIVFIETKDGHASVARPEDLIVLAFALGIPIEEMELALTKRTIQTAQDLLLVPFTADQAKEACDALAKAIYNGVFTSIVRQVNILTTPPPIITGSRKAISLVDIFGFESFDVNRFEQFCVNFASERLQQKYILDTLKRHTVEYTAEGIALPDWKNIDNSDTMHLLEGHCGVIKTLNEQCLRPNGSSEVRK